MTDVDTAHPNFRSGFRIARLAQDPTWRQRLRDAGHDGHPIVPLHPDDPIGCVSHRVYPEDPRVLLAIADDGAPHGVRLVWWQAIAAPATDYPRCPRCGNHAELHPKWAVCPPCAIAEGWEAA